MDGNRSPEPRKTPSKVFFDEGEREGPGNLNLVRGLFPCQSLLSFRGRLMEKDVFSRYSDLVQLTLDDLVDQKNLLRKIFLKKRFFPYQVGICTEGEEAPEQEG